MSQIEVLGAGERTLDTVVGTGALAFDAVRRPTTTARRVQRRGAVATQQTQRQVSETVDVVSGVPEKVLHASLRVVKGQARRKDAIGYAARTILNAVNAPASDAVRFFVRLEKATELPKRAPRTAASPRKATRAVKRTAAKATGTKRTRATGTTRRTAVARPTATGTRRGTGTRRTARRSA